ncbi:hypothetical protein IWQ60_004720 [Tieghemiomyces parasiticus]|uniref:G patch domain-containing protein n=1 Tax=Tieghemiomyces parasiticus TaxID=78921 RepID=A0A9W8AAH1_9FUNG|nr:hypothetical protein IWQ60_004720 [Tieghemiomyces parasiticus]
MSRKRPHGTPSHAEQPHAYSEDDADLAGIGTGFDEPLAREHWAHKGDSVLPYEDYRPAWQIEARDEQGNRRFHGAFTGGFSAGYFNTVGSKEGWAPQAFYSSRSRKRRQKVDTEATAAAMPGNVQDRNQPSATVARQLTQSIDDFMDDEDKRDRQERLLSAATDRSSSGVPGEFRTRRPGKNRSSRAIISFDPYADPDDADATYIEPHGETPPSFELPGRVASDTQPSTSATRRKIGPAARGPVIASIIPSERPTHILDLLSKPVQRHLGLAEEDSAAIKATSVGQRLLDRIGWAMVIGGASTDAAPPVLAAKESGESRRGLGSSHLNLAEALLAERYRSRPRSLRAGPSGASPSSTRSPYVPGPPSDNSALAPPKVTPRPAPISSFRMTIVDSEEESSDPIVARQPATANVTAYPSSASASSQLAYQTKHGLIPVCHITLRLRQGRCHDSRAPLAGFVLYEERIESPYTHSTVTPRAVPSDFTPGKRIPTILRTQTRSKPAPARQSKPTVANSTEDLSSASSPRVETKEAVAAAYMADRTRQRLVRQAQALEARLQPDPELPVTSRAAPTTVSASQANLNQLRRRREDLVVMAATTVPVSTDSHRSTGASPASKSSFLSAFAPAQEREVIKTFAPGLYRPDPVATSPAADVRSKVVAVASALSATSQTDSIPLPRPPPPPKVRITNTRADVWLKTAAEAAAMNFFGPMTRRVATFHPHGLLCRRFGVPKPAPIVDVEAPAWDSQLISQQPDSSGTGASSSSRSKWLSPDPPVVEDKPGRSGRWGARWDQPKSSAVSTLELPGQDLAASGVGHRVPTAADFNDLPPGVDHPIYSHPATLVVPRPPAAVFEAVFADSSDEEAVTG